MLSCCLVTMNALSAPHWNEIQLDPIQVIFPGGGALDLAARPEIFGDCSVFHERHPAGKRSVMGGLTSLPRSFGAPGFRNGVRELEPGNWSPVCFGCAASRNRKLASRRASDALNKSSARRRSTRSNSHRP